MGLETTNIGKSIWPLLIKFWNRFLVICLLTLDYNSIMDYLHTQCLLNTKKVLIKTGKRWNPDSTHYSYSVTYFWPRYCQLCTHHHTAPYSDTDTTCKPWVYTTLLCSDVLITFFSSWYHFQYLTLYIGWYQVLIQKTDGVNITKSVTFLERFGGILKMSVNTHPPNEAKTLLFALLCVVRSGLSMWKPNHIP